MRDLMRRVYQLEQEIERLKTQSEVGRWIDWTPTVYQNGNVAISIDYARVFYFNGMVNLLCDVTVTGTGTASYQVEVRNLPYSIKQTAGRVAMGSFIISAPTAYSGTVDNFGSDRIIFLEPNAKNFMGVNPSFALASGNTISFVAIYEAV